MKKILATLAVACLTLVNVNAGEFPDISIDELKKAIKDGKATVIDVNSNKSYSSAHIPSAIHYGAVSKDIKTALPKDKDALIVAYCGGPSCQAYTKAAKHATKLGYTNVKHLSAGISGWKSAGEKTEAAK